MYKDYSEYVTQFYFDDKNVVRWNSNDQVPPVEIMTAFLTQGIIDQETMIGSLNTRKIEQDAFLEQYIASRKKHGYSREEKIEMRAAFGDEEVIDIFTGERVDY